MLIQCPGGLCLPFHSGEAVVVVGVLTQMASAILAVRPGSSPVTFGSEVSPQPPRRSLPDDPWIGVQRFRAGGERPKKDGDIETGQPSL
jgi:hypothetical protein